MPLLGGGGPNEELVMSRTDTLQQKEATLDAKIIQLESTQAVILIDSSLNAQTHVTIAAPSFTCTNTPITAPNIYLPQASTITNNGCIFTGNIIYYTSGMNPAGVPTDWYQFMQDVT